YTVNLEIDSIKYNRATNQLEVTLRNTEDQAAYLIGTYGISDSAQNQVTVGDTVANFIDGSQVKTFVYDVDPALSEGKITGDVFIIFGESAGSLEKELRTSWDIDSVRILDNCNIQINEVSLNLRSKQVIAQVENIANTECFTNVDVVDIVIAGEKGTFSSEGIAQIGAGDTKNIKIKVPDFEKEDAEDNSQIKLRAYYGERETTLLKVLEGRFDLLLKIGDILFYILIAVIAALLLLIIWRRRKGKEGPKASHKAA
ncbi:MAG TPA: hypothetical protein VJB12_00820, partial [Candidatus Nanoarchaeia archaeon]|nr:hypothetical protein [Candidatus Nanoarchaeia archaeon]